MNKKPLPPGFQARKPEPVDLPNPSTFRELRPAILGSPPVSVKARLFERKRVIIGFGIAAAFHITLGLAWWLTPPLRLKAGIDPARWVAVFSVVTPVKAVPATQSAEPAPAMRGRDDNARTPHPQ